MGLSTQVDLTSGNPLVKEIAPAVFGGIYTGYFTEAGYTTHQDLLGLTHIRWPGGTLAEQQEGIYGFNIPNLFDAGQLFNPDPDRQRPGLTEMLQMASKQDVPLSLVVPTARYADDPQRGFAELSGFLTDLLNGVYGVPADRIILEIGNEYGFQHQFDGRPDLYGEIANGMTSVIAALKDDFLADHGAIVDVAVQMGFSAEDDAIIRGEFSQENLLEIDGLIVHQLPINLKNLHASGDDSGSTDFGKSRFQRTEEYFDDWGAAISAAGGDARDVELNLSAWTVGASEADASKVDVEFNDYGLRGASTALDLIYNYTSIGIDRAAVWGVDAVNLNAVSRGGASAPVFSPFGVMVGWMAESLVGLSPLAGSEAGTRADASLTYSFVGDDRLVVYVVANDASQPAHDVVLGLDHGFRALNAKGRILESYLPIGIDPSDQDARLHEVAAVEAFFPQWMTAGLGLEFDQDFSVAEITFDLPGTSVFGTANGEVFDLSSDDAFLLAGDGDDTITAYGGDDILDAGDGDDFVFAGGGNDIVYGAAGDDALFGGRGSDKLYGNEGQDTLSGGLGADELWGGLGEDTFVFSASPDVDKVHDFSLGDLLDVSRALAPFDGFPDPRIGTFVSDLAGFIQGSPGATLDIQAIGSDLSVGLVSDLGDDLLRFILIDTDMSEITVDDFVF